MGMDLLSDICREIDARLAQLRPALAEYEQLLDAADALGLNGDSPAAAPRPAPRASGSKPRATSAARKPLVKRSGRAVHDDVREAILGVLEHGSHTVAELTVVTAIGAASLNRDLRKLAATDLVRQTRREGKVAWSLVVAD
jgi:DNA-binding transcriptional ArsR family regulator